MGLPAEYVEKRDLEDQAQVEQNLVEFGSVYNPYTDSASRIHYLNAKYGARGWAAFLEKTESVERERLGLFRDR